MEHDWVAIGLAAIPGVITIMSATLATLAVLAGPVRNRTMTADSLAADLTALETTMNAVMANKRDAGPADDSCPHDNATSVESVVTGELLAVLCPDCDKQLPAEWWHHRNAVAGLRRADRSAGGECAGR
jgi:hypothetical protein